MPRKEPACSPSSRTSASTSRSTYCCHDLPPSPPPHGRPTTWQQTRAPPTPLEADVPYSGLRKGGLLHKHSRQHATKTQCWSSCKDPPFPTPPACPPASTSTTSTASTTCLPHPPPTLLPPPRPARLLSYSLPAYTTRRGGPVPGGLPPAPPCPAVKEPATDLATLIDAPYDYRKRRRVPRRVPPSVFADLSPCQAWSTTHAPFPPPSRDPCASAPPSSRLRSSSPPSRPPSPLSPCLLHKVHITRPKPLRLRFSHALPPAHAHPHPPWLIIVHLYYYHGPPRPATTRTRLQRAVQPRMPHRPDTPCCHVPYWRLCNMRVRPTTA